MRSPGCGGNRFAVGIEAEGDLAEALRADPFQDAAGHLPSALRACARCSHSPSSSLFYWVLQQFGPGDNRENANGGAWPSPHACYTSTVFLWYRVKGLSKKATLWKCRNMNRRCFFRHRWHTCVCERCGQTRASDHRSHRWQGCACRTCGITRHRLVSGICTECRARILDPHPVHFGSSGRYDSKLTAHTSSN
jgi:hypothetical protein